MEEGGTTSSSKKAYVNDNHKKSVIDVGHGIRKYLLPSIFI
jgi:hypothetical protein